MSKDDLESGQFRFRLGRHEQLVVFKQKGESFSHLQLKAIAYALYFRGCENLQLSPVLDYKVQPDLAALNLQGEPEIWIQCADCNPDKLEYICKHVRAKEVVLVAQENSTEALVARLRKRIHFRYTVDKLKVINFRPPVEDWFEADRVAVPIGSYDLYEF